MRFILGPLIVAGGILIMKYSVQITNIFGQVDFAEKYLRGGIGAGTYTLWKIMGLLAAILGAFWTLGLLGLVGQLAVWLAGGTLRRPQ